MAKYIVLSPICSVHMSCCNRAQMEKIYPNFSVPRLVGDVLVATAFLSYSGPFNQDFRAVLTKNWTKELKTRRIPFSANLDIIDMLTDPTTVSYFIGFF